MALACAMGAIFGLAMSPTDIAGFHAECMAKKQSLKLKNPGAAKREIHPNLQPLEIDSTAIAAIADSIVFAGFDHPATSRKETFLVTNNSPLTLINPKVRITYTDLDDRMLHAREEELKLEIPPGETRQAVITAFDPQSTLYYYKSKAPRNGGQPFKVSIILLSASTRRR
ncbi:MAG: hypothetical protein K2G75_02435 [Muribaculaceae bacterium]|nr:hypothetical protein [Muribaculaceae bacterium]